MNPVFPIYIPSKGRADTCYTARHLDRDGVPFKLVVEPQETAAYVEKFGVQRVLQLPFSNPGSVIPARNWIKDHATSAGAKRHWQLDDNIDGFRRVFRGQRLYCHSAIALRAAEIFTERYENIAISGLEYTMFFVPGGTDKKPLRVNTRVYSCSLVLNAIPYRWRGRYNEDTDICLQALAGGWCTVLICAFLCNKKPTMVIKGGNTHTIYQGDGRLKMARSLERMWPGVVTTRRRFQRPQHVVANSWQKFDTPLRRRTDIDWDHLECDELGMKIVQTRPEIKSARLRALKDEFSSHQAKEDL